LPAAYGGIAVLVIIGASLVAFALLGGRCSARFRVRFNRSPKRPHAVSDRRDTRTREQNREDEWAVTDAFNHMLARIENRMPS